MHLLKLISRSRVSSISNFNLIVFILHKLAVWHIFLIIYTSWKINGIFLFWMDFLDFFFFCKAAVVSSQNICYKCHPSILDATRRNSVNQVFKKSLKAGDKKSHRSGKKYSAEIKCSSPLRNKEGRLINWSCRHEDSLYFKIFLMHVYARV